MIPIPLYLTAVQSNLELGFADFRLAVAIQAGWGAWSEDWTSDQIVELGHDVNEAYCWILNPSIIPGERLSHRWSFLEQWTSVVTVSGTWEYTLPPDFGSFVGTHMEWGVNEPYTKPRKVSDSVIRGMRAQNNTSGRPEAFALTWLAQTMGSRQRQQLILYPTPDGVYTMYHKYAVLTGELSESNPFPLGGPRIGQLMMEFGKAVGENKKNGFRGDQWGTAMDRLTAEITTDRETNTEPTVGMMRGAGDYRMPIIPGNASYYFGPDVSAYGSTGYQLETV